MNFLDLFSGIGGFSLGFKEAGYKFDYHGFSEIDKFATELYKRRFPNATELGSITDVRCEQLPEHIDILCGGFPCQSFSIAGLRGGFEDTRGTLFFEIVRILRHYKDSGQPIPCFILENVKGLLSHDDGRTFAIIYRVLTDLNYSVECQLLNTRWFLPQNRERIYIVGHFRGESRRKIFPIGEIGNKANELQGQFTNTLKARYEAIGDVSYIIEGEQYAQEGLKQIGTIGKDSEATRVYDPSGCARTIKNGGGMGAKTGLYQVKPVLTPERAEKRQNGRRFKDDGEDMLTLTSQDHHGVMVIGGTQKNAGKMEDCSTSLTEAMGVGGGHIPIITQSQIRRLTPTECERLQGFPDGWTEGQSDTQRYKQLGNAVSVPVVKAIGDKLKCL